MLCKTKKQGLSVGEKFLRNITNNKISFGEEGLFIELGEIRELVQQEWNRRFEKKFGELEAFKDEFGHCHVPRKFVNNPSLGQWCSDIRCSYNAIEKGNKAKKYNISQDRIERLEDIGFLWQGVRASKYNKRTNNMRGRGIFKERCRELIAFKEEFGHCNVPNNFANNPSLGQWCSTMRGYYKKIQNEMITDINLSQDRIDHLEEIGFLWQGVRASKYNKRTNNMRGRGIFKERCRELIAFKEEFGHCNVPNNFANNPSLGQWCSTMRGYYKKIQNEMITDINLSQDRIDHLEEIGFLWQGVRASKYNKRNKTKDEEVEEVMAATIGTFDEVKIKDNDILLIFGKEATDPYPNNVELYSKTLKENHKAFTETNL